MLLPRTGEERSGRFRQLCSAGVQVKNGIPIIWNMKATLAQSLACLIRASMEQNYFSPPAGKLEYQPHSGHAVFTSNERELIGRLGNK